MKIDLAIEYEQWIRYRKEISHLLKTRGIIINGGEYYFVKDFFSEKTQEEIYNKPNFEGIDEI